MKSAINLLITLGALVLAIYGMYHGALWVGRKADQGLDKAIEATEDPRPFLRFMKRIGG
ncbi:MAG: hypothetical protein AAB386_02165 [Patescibacteria group bacterium]